MSLILATLLQAAGHLPPADVVGDRAKDVSQVYWDCVIERTERFENSGESADDVAKAAMTTCDTLDVELESEIIVFQLAQAVGAGVEPENEQIAARTDAILGKFRATLLEKARLRVVDIRTRRALGELQ